MKLDIREFKLHVYGKRQTSDSSCEFLQKILQLWWHPNIVLLTIQNSRCLKGKLCIWKKIHKKPSSKASRILIGFVSYGTHQYFQKFAENCRKGAGNFVHGFSSYHVRRLISVITQQVTCCCTKHMPIGTIWSLHSYAHCMTPSQLTCEQAPKPS